MARHLSTVYVSGWQCSSTASVTNEPGPDLADVRHTALRHSTELQPSTSNPCQCPAIPLTVLCCVWLRDCTVSVSVYDCAVQGGSAVQSAGVPRSKAAPGTQHAAAQQQRSGRRRQQ